MFSPQNKAFGVFLGFENLDLNIFPIFQLIKKIKAASHTTGSLKCMNVLWLLTTAVRVSFAYVKGAGS